MRNHTRGQLFWLLKKLGIQVPDSIELQVQLLIKALEVGSYGNYYGSAFKVEE